MDALGSVQNSEDQFQAAFARSTELYGDELNPELDLEHTRAYGQEVVAEVVADFRDGVVTSAMELPGHCFNAVREASYVLFEMGIDNAVTIGTVSVNGQPHFSTTRASVERDLQEGFKPMEHITNAHAWLTLDSGQILDPTILPSWAHREEGRELGLEEAIYLDGVTRLPLMVHEPFITGFSYHLRVLSHPFFLPTPFHRYAEWLEHSRIFKRKIRRARAA
jgi:hypothetical protein